MVIYLKLGTFSRTLVQIIHCFIITLKPVKNLVLKPLFLFSDHLKIGAFSSSLFAKDKKGLGFLDESSSDLFFL